MVSNLQIILILESYDLYVLKNHMKSNLIKHFAMLIFIIFDVIKTPSPEYLLYSIKISEISYETF